MAAIAATLLGHEQRHYNLARQKVEPIAILDSMEKALVLPGQTSDAVSALWGRVRPAYTDSINASIAATHATNTTSDIYPKCVLTDPTR